MPPSTPCIIPVFLPHRGCMHRCVFCNQHAITGLSAGTVTPVVVQKTIAAHLERRRWPGREVQVAFYGGSFTALAWSEQEVLLDAVSPFLAAKTVAAIRLSTRPDCLDAPLLEKLAGKGVRIIELGVQSMDDRVLSRCRRGHDAAASEGAVNLLKERGFTTGVQLLIGLPGECRAGMMAGVRRLVRLRPDFVRIYPAVVVAGSPMAEDYRAGIFRPLSLAMAVLQVAWMKRVFTAAGIPVVRMGLQDCESLNGSILAGPHHPAFGEMVAGRLVFREARRLLRSQAGRACSLLVSARDTSVFLGHRRDNHRRLRQLGLLDRTEIVFDPLLERGTMRVVQGEGEG
ncbi:MAG: radical SAM protein [Thermodesulfobacteriota bacterium]